MNDTSVNNTALIEEYDVQISNLIRERDRLVGERDKLKRKNQDNADCYDSTLKAKNELQGVLNNISDYARTSKQKVDSRIKLLRNMYEFLERSTTQPKIQRQIEELNTAMNSVKGTTISLDIEIDNLNTRIGNVEREIERIRGLKGAIING